MSHKSIHPNCHLSHHIPGINRTGPIICRVIGSGRLLYQHAQVNGCLWTTPKVFILGVYSYQPGKQWPEIDITWLTHSMVFLCATAKDPKRSRAWWKGKAPWMLCSHVFRRRARYSGWQDVGCGVGCELAEYFRRNSPSAICALSLSKSIVATTTKTC